MSWLENTAKRFEESGATSWEGLASLEDKEKQLVSMFQELEKQFQETASGLENMVKNVSELETSMSSPRAQKGISLTSKLGATFQKAAGPIVEFVSQFTPLQIGLQALTTIFQALKPLIDMIGLLFQAFGAGLMQALAPLFQTFAEMMPELIPIFIEIGKLIGEVIAIALIPLIEMFKILAPIFLEVIAILFEPLKAIFEAMVPILIPIIEAFGVIVEVIGKALTPILESIGKIFLALLPILEPIILIIGIIVEILLTALAPVLDILSKILEPLGPLFGLLADMLEPLSPVIEVIGEVLGWLIQAAMVPFIGALYGIGIFIAGLIDFFSFGTAGAIDAWNDLMLPILEGLVGDVLEGPDLEGGGGGEVPTVYTPGFQEFAEGGVVFSDSIVRVGEKGPEIIQPLDEYESAQNTMIAYLGSMLDEMVLLTEYNRQLVQNKEFKYAFER